MRDILSKFLPSQLPRNCSKPFRTLVIHGDMARHGQTWLISHQEFENTHAPCVKTGTNQIINTLHVIIDPNIFCMFRAGNSRFCTTFAENSNIFLRISRLGKPSEMPPNCGASIFWALPLRPRATVVLRVHRCPFAQQKLCRRDVAADRRRVQRHLASGAFSRGRRPLWPKPREMTNVVGSGALVPVQPTNER